MQSCVVVYALSNGGKNAFWGGVAFYLQIHLCSCINENPGWMRLNTHTPILRVYFHILSPLTPAETLLVLLGVSFCTCDLEGMHPTVSADARMIARGFISVQQGL